MMRQHFALFWREMCLDQHNVCGWRCAFLGLAFLLGEHTRIKRDYKRVKHAHIKKTKNPRTDYTRG